MADLPKAEKAKIKAARVERNKQAAIVQKAKEESYKKYREGVYIKIVEGFRKLSVDRYSGGCGGCIIKEYDGHKCLCPLHWEISTIYLCELADSGF